MDNILYEIDIQKEIRARKRTSPKVVYRPEVAPLVPKINMDFPTRSNDPTPIRRRETSLGSSADDEEQILGSTDCHKLENLLSQMDGANTISSAKQCTKSMLDKIAENQIRQYLNRRDREITVGAIPQVQTTSITPPSDGMIATQVLNALNMSFAIVLEQLKTMDPGPHFDSRNQGRISGAAALARALNLVNSDHYRQAILRLPLDQQWAALVITGALSSDYRSGHQMMHRLSTCQFESPLSALSAHAQRRFMIV